MPGCQVVAPSQAPLPAGNTWAGGPARLCQALDIGLTFNDADVARGHDLYVETGEPLPDTRVAAGPRVGIDYASEQDRSAEWRLFVRDSAHLSR